jgi:hypothetical protein
VDLPLLLVHHVIDPLLGVTLLVGNLRPHDQKLLVLTLTLLVLLKNNFTRNEIFKQDVF